MNKKLSGKPTVLKEVNIGLLKKALSEKGQATRVELSAMTGISQPTVNLLVRELYDNGVVTKLGEADSTGGRRAEVYTLNAKKQKILLVAVYADYFEVVVADLALQEEIHRKRIRNREELCHIQLRNLILEMKQQEESIGAVSIGVEGVVVEDGTVFAIPSVPEWENMSLVSWLAETISIPIRIINDVNAATYGYAEESEAIQNMVYLYTDRNGIGAGIYLNGRLYPGIRSFAGELGYMQLGEKNVEELMHDGKSSLEDVIAQVAVNITCILNPEKIVIAGHQDTEQLISKAEQLCKKVLPASVVPKMEKVENQTLFYFKGLGRLGIEAMSHNLQIL